MQNKFDILTKKILYNRDHLAFISLLLLKYNLRCSEILDVSKKDLHYPHFIIFRGKKKSSNIIIRDDFVVNYFYNLLPNTKDKFFDFINYNCVYNYFRKNFSHLFTQFKTNKNNKVTHGPRYFFSRLTNEPDIVRDILYHRSIKSGSYYNKNIRSN